MTGKSRGMPEALGGNGRENTASKSRLRLWLKLLKVTRMIESEVRESLRLKHDSTLPRFDVMAALYRFEGGLRMTELSSVLKVSNGNVTGIVDRLVASGLVKRVPVADDKRVMTVRLTDTGREEFASLAREHEQWIDHLLAPVNGAEATLVNEHLEKIAVNLEQASEKN